MGPISILPPGKRGNLASPQGGLTVAMLSFRIAYGAALIVAPAKVAGNRWLGPGGPSRLRPRCRCEASAPVRSALHGLALVAYLRGAPVRPLLAASIAGDLTDIGATSLARGGLPADSAAATAAVAGGSALLTTVAAALAEE